MEFINRKKKKPKFDDFLDHNSDKQESLYDDPEWAELRESVKRRAKKDVSHNKGDAEEGLPANPKAEPERVELNIKLSLPNIGVQKLRALKDKIRPNKKILTSDILRTKTAYAVLAVTVLAICLLLFWPNKKSENTQKQGNATGVSGQQSTPATGVEEEVSHDPAFSVITPSGGIDKNSIIYSPQRNFAKFDDKISGVAITVSQQPLPGDFSSDPEGSLEGLADNLGATEVVQTGSGIAYIQENVAGQQTVVFVKFGLLVFIKTQSRIETGSIAKYIDTLN